MRSIAAAIGAAVLLCLAWGSASAETVKLTADLTSAGAATGPGKGTATMTLDTGAKTLNWTVEYSGLANPPAMAGFLAPAAKPDDDPDMVPVDLPSDIKSPIKGSMTLTEPQVSGIQGGAWVFLIGTTEAPEIGGEVKKAP